MACTIVFVFYQNKGGSTLVKILLNGEEAHLPIPSVQGPFYDWEAFKSYFKSITR